jgi:hypothetical protein
MRLLAILLLAFLAPAAARASCARPADQPWIGDDAQVVFIATITAAKLATPVAELRNFPEGREHYRVDYEFEVREVLRGDPANVRLFSQQAYHDLKARPFSYSEERYGPGENVVVIAQAPGDVQLCFCCASGTLDHMGAYREPIRAELAKLREENAKKRQD